jgi:hypothetical protein
MRTANCVSQRLFIGGIEVCWLLQVQQGCKNWGTGWAGVAVLESWCITAVLLAGAWASPNSSACDAVSCSWTQMQLL